MTAEEIAKRFHETYEELAPSFNYKPRKATSVPWDQVPLNNRKLMIATVQVAVMPEIERLEARIAELERQNKLLLDDVQGIAEANIPACDAAEFAYSMRRDCKETLKALTVTPE